MACASTAISSAISGALCLALAACSSSDASPVQPFAFNHQAHVKADVDCLQCHEGVLDVEASRLPTLETCAGCHTDPPGDHKGKQQLAEMVAAKVELRWVTLVREPDYVFFSHLRHVDGAGMECTACHGDMPGRTSPPTRERVMGMYKCMSCHAKHADRPGAKRAATDCAACHR